MSSSSQSASLSSAASSSSSASAALKRGVKLRRHSQTRYLEGLVQGFRMKVTAYDAYLMSNYIFRFLRQPADPLRGEEEDVCDGVCSAIDLEELPSGSPRAGDNPPYFRKEEVDWVFATQTEANEAWGMLLEEVANLIRSLNCMDILEVTDEIELGGPTS
jgi:hypothetical protein